MTNPHTDLTALYGLMSEADPSLDVWTFMPFMVGYKLAGFQQVAVDFLVRPLAEHEDGRIRILAPDKPMFLDSPVLIDPDVFMPVLDGRPDLPGAEKLIVDWGLEVEITRRIRFQIDGKRSIPTVTDAG